MPAKPSTSTSAAVTNRPISRSAGRRTTRTSQAQAATRLNVTTNSYMLPHGTRPAARPRVTSTPTCAAAAAAVTQTAIRPKLTALAANGGRGAAAVRAGGVDASGGSAVPAVTTPSTVVAAPTRAGIRVPVRAAVR